MIRSGPEVSFGLVLFSLFPRLIALKEKKNNLFSSFLFEA
jgi:hypothetical protein